MRLPKPAAVGAAVVILGAMASASAASTAAAVTPTITQFSSGLAATAEPVAITAGPEATLWFGLRGATALGRSTLQGGISSYSTLDNANVVAVTEGPEGDIWFLETGGGAKVGRLEPASGLISEYAEPTTAKLADLVFGPDHQLWFVGETGSTAAIYRMNPATGSYDAEYKVPTAGAKPAGLTFGREGDIWFTETANPGAIGAFEPGTNLFAEYKLPTSNANPTGIATGPEGDIFFTGTNDASIGRLNPMSHEIAEFSSGLVGGKPQQIVAGADGALYFTDSSGAVARMTNEGAITEYKSGLEKTEPWGISDGPDGNVWFTEKNNPGRIGRLTLAPGAASASAEHVAPTTATLAAKVSPRGQATSYFFEYGTSTSYGSHTSSATLAPESSPVSVAAGVAGLSPRTTYHFRVVAMNATGTTDGGDGAFTTGAPEVPPPTKPHVPSLEEDAVLGKDAGAAAASGTILVQNSSGTFVPLQGPQALPIGAVIEATKGTVRLVTALAKKGTTQSVLIWGGRFKLAQSTHGNGLTKIILRGSLPTCTRKGAAHLASKKSKSRKLWAEDNHGRYSTYGANSVATVLGTKWETLDSCAGTRTRVLKGKVRVRDVHTEKTVVVSAGHSFLARR